MLNSELTKDIIKANEEFILNEIKDIIPRKQISEPTKFASDRLKKVNIFHGVRRSGKTFLLYDIFQNNKESSLYIDFEDERLRNLELDDLDLIKENFFELKPHLIDQNKIFFLLDEVQNIDGWERFARKTYFLPFPLSFPSLPLRKNIKEVFLSLKILFILITIILLKACWSLKQDCLPPQLIKDGAILPKCT